VTWPKSKPKYVPGEPIATEADLARASNDNVMVFVYNRFKGRPISARFVANQSWSLVRYLLGRKDIFRAVRNPETIS
jgi:hypothetical protein